MEERGFRWKIKGSFFEKKSPLSLFRKRAKFRKGRLIYCPTKKMALLSTSLPLSQKPLKMGLSTK
jgi:hypothetical protein